MTRFDCGGGECRHCHCRLPEWDTRDHCDSCLADCNHYHEEDNEDDSE